MESKLKTSVFVYGTLKPGGYYHEAYCGCFQYESMDGYVNGQLFEFPTLGYPGAAEHSAGNIKGALLQFDHPEKEVLPKLDSLEGYAPSRPAEENEYYRIQVPVFDEKRRVICDLAWCYFVDRQRIKSLGGVPIPDGHWSL